MSRWFRMYDDLLDDPKVQRLPDRLFRGWVNLLCVASRNDGHLPIGDIAFLLRISESQSISLLKELAERGLLDNTEDHVEPHNWHKRQHKSDVSNDRVARYRKRQRNGDGNVTGNASNASPRARVTDTDTEAETERKNSEADASAAASPAPPDLIVIDARTELFRGGLDDLRAMTGKPEAKCRKLMGLWLKEADDDAGKVRRAIAEACRDKKADPVAWIAAAVKPSKGGENWRERPEMQGVL